MPALSTYVIFGGSILFALLIVAEFLRSRNGKRLALQGGALLFALLILRFTVGFPTPSTARAFGGVSPEPAIGLMFVGVVLGIAARYIFYLRGKFRWRSFLKPLCVSPIVLLPLLQNLEGVTRIESVELITFLILSFQNGFFWRVIFEQDKPDA